MKPVLTPRPKRGGIIADPVPKRHRLVNPYPAVRACESCGGTQTIPFTRMELKAIAVRAIRSAQDMRNPLWFRAYNDLADAADRLDAMIARAEDRNTEFESILEKSGKETRK